MQNFVILTIEGYGWMNVCPAVEVYGQKTVGHTVWMHNVPPCTSTVGNTVIHSFTSTARHTFVHP